MLDASNPKTEASKGVLGRHVCLPGVIEDTINEETKWLKGSVSDADSISGDEIREPRRGNSPSDLSVKGD